MSLSHPSSLLAIPTWTAFETNKLFHYIRVIWIVEHLQLHNIFTNESKMVLRQKSAYPDHLFNSCGRLWSQHDKSHSKTTSFACNNKNHEKNPHSTTTTKIIQVCCVIHLAFQMWHKWSIINDLIQWSWIYYKQTWWKTNLLQHHLPKVVSSAAHKHLNNTKQKYNSAADNQTHEQDTIITRFNTA